MGLLLAVCVLSGRAAFGGFELSWEGSRVWTGSETWATPLYDWKVQDGKVVVSPAANRLLQQTVWRIDDASGSFQTEAQLRMVGLENAEDKEKVWAGFAVGIQGLMNHPLHVLVGPKKRIQAGVRGDGRAFIGGAVSDGQIDPSQTFRLHLKKSVVGLSLLVTVPDTNETIVVHKKLPDFGMLEGNIGLGAIAIGEAKGIEGLTVEFDSWSADGDALTERQRNSFGPILWSQYTRQGNDVKLLAMLAPLGEEDPKSVSLEVRSGAGWAVIDTQDYDPLTYSALLTGVVPYGEVDYRVRYNYQGEDHFWFGTFIVDPATTAEPLKIGVFSCDHGYAFPLPQMVKNVKEHDPNLLFFAGDQIYENYGGFRVIRRPVQTAMLDYLRKYYQFGWTWRELLKDRPSIIIPDDHDVFQGNLWGEGGKQTDDTRYGGYEMDPAWINGVQRTQTASLPDPYDPTPVEQGIGVYYTQMEWGGVPIAILEDRKWKSGPLAILPVGSFADLTEEELDPEGAQLLGERQESFLNAWSRSSRKDPVRFILSQSIFCQGNTHAGPELKPTGIVTDTNGWPRSGRQRALGHVKDGKTIMLHGDQHLGLLLRHGVDEFNDGPYAFMVPGTSNGWPRAWWPNGSDGEVTGDFTDPFGNKFSVLAAANPEPGTGDLKTFDEGFPQLSAHIKGSGYGLVIVDPETHAVTFNMYRYRFDAANPQPDDQFPGFPVTIEPE